MCVCVCVIMREWFVKLLSEVDLWLQVVSYCWKNPRKDCRRGWKVLDFKVPFTQWSMLSYCCKYPRKDCRRGWKVLDFKVRFTSWSMLFFCIRALMYLRYVYELRFLEGKWRIWRIKQTYNYSSNPFLSLSFLLKPQLTNTFLGSLMLFIAKWCNKLLSELLCSTNHEPIYNMHPLAAYILTTNLYSSH